jgi:alpha-mannosidase
MLEEVKRMGDRIAGIPINEMKVYLVGNTHIDLSWLWPKSETIEEIIPNTFRNVLDLMDRYDSLCFSQSSAQIYIWVEEHYPDIFERIREKVKEGRWEIVGGSWCEHNANILDGESLVRQHLYGKRYFMDRFGVDVKVGWLPDTFGFAWTLPQIYARCGIRFFLTHKLKWQIERMSPPIPFPYHLFWWEAPDGSRVLSCHTVGSYTESIDEDRIKQQLRRMVEVHGIPILIFLFGRGDHGGGPTEEMIVKGIELQRRDDFPKLLFSRAEDYFSEMEDLSNRIYIPVVRDELYVKTHRGTFTTEAMVKRENRRCEMLLLDSEKLSTLAHLLGHPYPKDELEEAWKLLLFGQVHDNIDGTSINQVYVEAAEDYRRIRGIGSRAASSALKAISEEIDTMGDGMPVLLFNTLSFDRDGVVEIQIPEGWKEAGVLGPDGYHLPSQEEDGKLIFVAKDVPSIGYSVYRLKPEGFHATTELYASEEMMENEFFKVSIDRDSGCISSILDKANGVEVVAEGGYCNMIRVYEDRPPNAPGGEPAWNIYLGDHEDLLSLDSLELVRKGPVKATVRARRRFGNSVFVQDLSLISGIPLIECETRVWWQERYRFAKAVFMLSFGNVFATYEIPYGVIQRYDYTLDGYEGTATRFPERPWEEADKAKFEVPALRWADLERDDGSYGISIINDSKYGYSIKGNEVELSLLRGPNRGYPGMELSFSDQSDDPLVGEHVIRYAIYPHKGRWDEAMVVQMGYGFNYPIMVEFPSAHGGRFPSRSSFISVNPPNVICSTVKMSEDENGIVIRIYESCGKETEARIHINPMLGNVLEASVTDMMEWGKYTRDGSEVKVSGNDIYVPLRAFEIATLNISIGP